MSRLKDLPALARDGSNINAVIEAMREAMQTFRGYRGDPLDTALTYRMAQKSGLFNPDGTIAVGAGGVGPPGPVGPPGADGGAVTPDLTPPPTPTGLTVTAGISYLYIHCDTPVYTQGHGHDRTVVYGAKWLTGSAPTFTNAVELFQFQGTFASYPSEPATRWCIWIKWKSMDGVLSTTPGGGTNGVQATTGQDVSLLLEALTGKITASQLYADLGARIDLIDAADTVAGSVAARILAEATARISGLAAESTLRVNDFETETATWNSLSAWMTSASGNIAGNAAAIVNEQNARVTAVSAEASARTTLAARVTTNETDIATGLAAIATANAALTTESSTRASADSALSSRTTALESSVNSPTSGLSTKASVAYADQAKADAISAAASSIATVQAQLDTGGTTAAAIAAANAAAATAASQATAANANVSTALDAANAAQSSANAANAEITNLASDNILSPSEKPSVVQDYTVIINEQSGIDAQATNYAITTEKTAYDTAVTALTTYLGTLAGWNTVPGSNVTIVGTTFRGKFADVYTSRQALLDAIAAKAKTIADAANTSAAAAQTAAAAAQSAATTASANVATAISASNAAVTAANAVVSDITTLQARLNTGDYAAVKVESSANASAVTGLNAQYTVKVDANGYVSGFGLAITSQNATPSSDFIIRADRFSIASPTGPGITPITPFIVNTTPTTEHGVAVPAGVYMDGAYIKNLTAAIARLGTAWIDNAMIANLSADKITAGNMTAGSYIRSSTYTSGSVGFSIEANGYAEFNNVVVRGGVYATSGELRNIVIRDAAGNVFLHAGSATFAGNVTGLIDGTQASTLVANTSTALSTANAASGAATVALSNASQALNAANAASNALASKLDNNARNLLAGAGGFATGSLNWDSNGNRQNGTYGIGFTQKGIVAYNSSGEATFTLDGANGNAYFKGTVNADSGNFKGSINVGDYTGWAWPAAGGTGVHISSNGIAAGNYNGGGKYFMIATPAGGQAAIYTNIPAYLEDAQVTTLKIGTNAATVCRSQSSGSGYVDVGFTVADTADVLVIGSGVNSGAYNFGLQMDGSWITGIELCSGLITMTAKVTVGAGYHTASVRCDGRSGTISIFASIR